MDGQHCAGPKVSVVIPAYNVERYIDQTLAALEGQTLNDIEIICVDDGSTDGTLSVIRCHALADPRVKGIHQENTGAGSARNAGLAVARGEWVAFLDADDVYRPGYLEKMLSSGERYGADLVVCELDCLIDGSGMIKPFYRIPSEVAGDSLRTGDYSERLFQLGIPQPSNKLFRLSYIREAGLQFQALPNCNDLFFTCAALAGSERVSFVREPLVTYRVSAGTSIQDDLVKRPSKEKCLCVYKALTALRDYCLRNGLLDQGVSGSFGEFSVLHSISAVTRALGHDDLFKEVFSFYQNALVNEWRVSEPDKSSGFETRLKYELMMKASASQFAWVYKDIGRSRNGGILRKVLLGVKALLVISRNRLAKTK